MVTFILSAILGIIVSWCLFGKEFNQKLGSVALTVLCVTFGSTLITSFVSLNYLKTEEVFTEKSKLVPYKYNKFVKDTTINFIKSVNKGKTVMKQEVVINYDSIPVYFKFNDSGEISFTTNYSSDGYEETYSINDIDVVNIDTTGWFGIKSGQYITKDNIWVTDFVLPNKYSKSLLFLNKKQTDELNNCLKEYNKNNNKNINLIAQNGK